MKRRWLLIILTVLFLWLVVSHFVQLEQLRDMLAQAKWGWVLAAVLTQMVYYLVFTDDLSRRGKPAARAATGVLVAIDRRFQRLYAPADPRHDLSLRPA
jgi:uncharacterized membrane protein YbhN (UPF0104 family)